MPYRLAKEVMIYTYNEALFETDSQIKYYIIGLILADGYISNGNRNSHRIEIALKEEDKRYLETIRDIVCSGKPLKYKQKAKAYRLTIDNKEIYEEVMKYVNDLPKSHNLIFPYGIPDQFLLHFIRGYSDGDGNIGVKYGRRTLKDGTKKKYFGLRYRILGNRPFLVGLETNLRRLGITKNVVKTHRKWPERVWYIEYGFSQASAVLEALYKDATVFLERKYKVFQKISNADSSKLEKVYGAPEGCYNTHSAILAKV